MISSISAFEIINVVTPNPIFFLLIPASAVDTAAGEPNGIKTRLGNGLRTFFIKSKPDFNNVSRSLTRNPLDCLILDSWVFDNFILADKLFTKTLQSFETCIST